MSSWKWYWHRLRAMEPLEFVAHLRRRWHGWAGARAHNGPVVALESAGDFPRLPEPWAAPEIVRAALREEVDEILAGRWRVFGRVQLTVQDPPDWHMDYLAGKSYATRQRGFRLNYRRFSGGGDIKLIWELSRWQPLVRLAQGAYVLGDQNAGRKCVEWLGDWAKHNPPFRGWNWTSALEAGIRLIQFAWIDALLGGPSESAGYGNALARLRAQLLPPHAWFTWRNRSCGSSANNHLLGELAGLVIATARWPGLTRWGKSLDALQRLWEREVLAQFAEDGGNREQALNYHLFAWEFCWQTKLALESAGREISGPVLARLIRAADFFRAVQIEGEPWDYGDSDNAHVTPFFIHDRTAVREWRQWMGGTGEKGGLAYWLGPASPESRGIGEHRSPTMVGEWRIFNASGMAVRQTGDWFLRWDLSELGYLKTAAHGHADAQHLSIWLKGMAMVIDPGTGAYYADNQLREWLASRAAHNGPCPAGLELARRIGPFLWSSHHPAPQWRLGESEGSDLALICELRLAGGLIRRTVRRLERGDGWWVADEFRPTPGTRGDFTVLWQFAPGSEITQLAERKFAVNRAGSCLVVEISSEWAEARVGGQSSAKSGTARDELEGVVSPGFRRTEHGPYLKLRADGTKTCVLPTAFLASKVP